MQFMTQSIIYKNTVLTCTNFLQGVTYFERGDESSINKLSNIHCADTSHGQQHPWITPCRSQVWAVNKKCCILAQENFTNFMAVSIIANQLFFGCIIFIQWHQFHGKYTTLGTLQKVHFHITEVIPSTVRPYQEVPWIEPHYICLQLLCLPLQHTSLYSPLIIQNSFHIHADSEDLQYGLGKVWGTKWEAISWTCMALAQWQEH
jgi:hypothetical protein